MSQPDALMLTYIWMSIFSVSTLAFFGIAVWIIIRGGKDVIEILTNSGDK